MRKRSFEYDVGLSFAGEQREFVEAVAKKLRSSGIKIFYDDFEKVEMWGKDLYLYLANVYTEKCRFCVIFASKELQTKFGQHMSCQTHRLGQFKNNRMITFCPLGSTALQFQDCEIP